ncbi:hypothetical protein L2E82_20507 [Cichorium intybus]|uniref:Uncharacterized protein n=1 Tax=Cichorium intybus TaxID=13427 RepID=A0ACB9DT90_CICIN|nr:hypothetical protein L2E82_20507 [Cichorium intybus]
MSELLENDFKLGSRNFDLTMEFPDDSVASTDRVLSTNIGLVDNFSTHQEGDVFYVNWDEVLPRATAVISTLGGFGRTPKFLLISVHDYKIPSFLLASGYFTGKRKAESEVLSSLKIPEFRCYIKDLGKVTIDSRNCKDKPRLMAMFMLTALSLDHLLRSGRK